MSEWLTSERATAVVHTTKNARSNRFFIVEPGIESLAANVNASPAPSQRLTLQYLFGEARQPYSNKLILCDVLPVTLAVKAFSFQ